MAYVLILPGHGSSYQSETITGAVSGQAGADVLDMSRCSQFAVQVMSIANAASSTLTVQWTLDGTNWAALHDIALDLAAGAGIRFGASSGPFGRIRLVVTDAAATVTVAFKVVGWNMQVSA